MSDSKHKLSFDELRVFILSELKRLNDSVDHVERVVGRLEALADRLEDDRKRLDALEARVIGVEKDQIRTKAKASGVAAVAGGGTFGILEAIKAIFF